MEAFGGECRVFFQCFSEAVNSDPFGSLIVKQKCVKMKPFPSRVICGIKTF